MTPEQYATLAADTLDGGITSGAASLTLHSAALFPAVPQFRVRCDNELMLVTTVAGLTLGGLTRGIEGTTAASHADGAAVTLVLTAASLQAVATNPIGGLATRGEGHYLAAWFTNAEQKLWLGTSNNGTAWNALGQAAAYTPASGTVRDPSLLAVPANATLSPQAAVGYWVCHTNETPSPTVGFDVIYAADLEDWSLVHRVDCSSVASSVHAWAPEWFVDADGSLHVFVGISTSGVTGFEIYELHPTNAAMTTWSTPVAVTGTSLPSDMIDPFVVLKGGTYYLWYKNETTKFLEVFSSSSLLSGYTSLHTGDWAGWGSGLEGVSVVQVDSGTWRIYADKYTAQGIYFSESTDNWASWSAKALVTSPVTMSHGTVLRLGDYPSQRNALGMLAGLMTPFTTAVSFITGNGSATTSWGTITSVALTAGTWLVFALANVRANSSGTTGWGFRLWDGTTQWASAELGVTAQFIEYQAFLVDVLRLEGDATLSLQAQASNANTNTVYASGPDFGLSNRQTGIVAVRIG